MNQILDEIDNKKNTKRIFSKLSFVASIITIALVGYLFAQIPSTIKANEGISEPRMAFTLAVNLFCILGVTMTVLSFSMKEPSNWFKWSGGILNILLFILIVVLVFFVRFG